MNSALLTDFGSTWTKVTAVDLDTPRLLGSAQAFTTSATDINEGHTEALRLLAKDIRQRAALPPGQLDNNGLPPFSLRRACSSAAGGLRMAVIGLIPELTAAAARQAALGAGAKVIHVFTGELTRADLSRLKSMDPDIILLTGGTDGGNREVITSNARRLAGLAPLCPVLLAGNRAAGDDCETCLSASGWSVQQTENVLPTLERMNTGPAQAAIRSLFLERIVRANGLSRAQSLLDGILMPTPAAVLSALRLLATGSPKHSGIGELMAFDAGGATTDVYSIADGSPEAGTILKGLELPRVSRTVEGDIGLRYSADGIVESVGLEAVAARAGLTAGEAAEGLERIREDKERKPGTPVEWALDRALAAWALRIASGRHAGRIERTYTPMGETWVQSGKDLRRVRQLVFTGGALIHAPDPRGLLPDVLWRDDEALTLRPGAVDTLWLDRCYLLSALGLLADDCPDQAFELMYQELEAISVSAGGNADQAAGANHE